MPSRPERTSTFERLRQQAEELLQKRPKLVHESPADILEVLQELHVHQAELEIQNEELQRAHQELIFWRDEYEALYEFAPCGYLTINARGFISWANLTAIKLLGLNRKHLMHSGFSSFIVPIWEG